MNCTQRIYRKKIKSAYRVKVAKGEYHGAFAPFGYMKDPNHKGKLIIDPVSSKTVKLIFELAKQGYGSARIRTVLINQKILTPAAYLYTKNPEKWYTKKFKNAPEKEFYAWMLCMIDRIRDNEIYIGNMIHYREISVSYKTKRRQSQPRDKWVRNEHTHEPIIDMETWNLVQERYRHRGRLPRICDLNIFQRIARCADCGRSMWLTPGQFNRKTGERTTLRYLQCQTNRDYGKTKCSLHNTSYKALKALILNDIRHYAKLAMEQPDELIKSLTDAENKHRQEAQKQAKRDYSKGTRRLAELENLLKKLFEENVAGRINDENYQTLLNSYQAEQKELKLLTEELSKKLSAFSEETENSRKFVDLIAKYADLQELDAPIVNELCEKILVHQAQKIDGRRVQKIEIFYRFIGKISSADGNSESNIRGSKHYAQ